MSNFQEKAREFARKALILALRAWEGLKRLAIWLSPPPRLTLTLLGLLFSVSLLSWAIGDRAREAVLFFPAVRGGSLHGESRNLPRSFSPEKTAELVASELLLGPIDPDLRPAFPPGIRVSATLYRHGILYLDLSPEAALAPRPELEKGLDALARSLRASLPWTRRLVLTIGGIEPWLEGLPGPSGGPKKIEKN